MAKNVFMTASAKYVAFALFYLTSTACAWGYEVVKDAEKGEYNVQLDIAKMHQVFVADTGNDDNSGTISKPFATLKRARNEIRQLKENKIFPSHGVVVQIRGGIYSLDETLKLDQSDSGTQSSPVVYQRYGQERVRLVGGVKLKHFRKLTDPGFRSRLNPDVVPHVIEVDLAANGLSDFGEIGPVGFSLAEKPTPMELFFQGDRMQLARWPNDDWAVTLEGRQFGRIAIPRDRLERWAFSEDMWIHSYLNKDWADYLLRVARIDPQNGDLQTESAVDIATGRRFYALNVPEELDKAGEWYLDREKGKLFFWPPSDMSVAEIYLSRIDRIVEVNDANDILFRGLEFEMCRATAVVVNNCSKVLVQACSIRNSGNYGVSISNGIDCGVMDSDISDTGYGGIILGGGDRKTLAPGRNFAFNNHVHHYSRWLRTYKPAVSINGVGNHVSHNLIHDAPHSAILFTGNDHVIEFNEIFKVCTETDDAGAIYTGRDWTMRGTHIRYNFIHDLVSLFKKGIRASGIYLDDTASGTSVYGNIFYRAEQAVFIGGGRDNIIKNNIFIENDPAIRIDSRMVGWAKEQSVLHGSWRLHEKLLDMNYNKPPYSERYPSLIDIWLKDPLLPLGNTITCNLFWKGKFFHMDKETEKHVVIQGNIIKDLGFTVNDGIVQISEAPFVDQECLATILYENIGRLRKDGLDAKIQPLKKVVP